jgi:hypothetical protein
MVAGEGNDQAVKLKNTGRKPLRVAVRIPREPWRSYGFGGWQNVTLDITSSDCSERVATTFRQLLQRGGVQVPCGALAGHSTVHDYTFHIDILPDALSRPDGKAKIGNFDLEFIESENIRP